jgi:hypothetical protein
MPRVFVVSHFAPSAIGHGGLHRTLQVEYDAASLVGPASVASVNLEHWRARRRPPSDTQKRRWMTRKLAAVQWRFDKIRRRARSIHENPFSVFPVERYSTAIPFSTSLSVEPEFVQHYHDIVSKETGPRVCIIEHALFGQILDLNVRLGIPTIAAFQNLEALDVTSFEWRNRKTVYRLMTDLGNELRLMGRCADRLAISKVEAGFVGGLGMACHYYPYLPVGVIREQMSVIRGRRARQAVEPGLIVLLGSAQHGVTGESMRWFARAALENGVPRGLRIVAVGGDTDRLLPPGRSVPGLELRGWLDQVELDALLERASAAVIPQRLGFGALTRLPELACAGLPVITFSHPTYALNPPPGLRVVAPCWADLCTAMKNGTRPVDDREYEEWEAAQPRPMAEALERVCLA